MKILYDLSFLSCAYIFKVWVNILSMVCIITENGRGGQGQGLSQYEIEVDLGETDYSDPSDVQVTIHVRRYERCIDFVDTIVHDFPHVLQTNRTIGVPAFLCIFQALLGILKYNTALCRDLILEWPQGIGHRVNIILYIYPYSPYTINILDFRN